MPAVARHFLDQFQTGRRLRRLGVGPALPIHQRHRHDGGDGDGDHGGRGGAGPRPPAGGGPGRRAGNALGAAALTRTFRITLYDNEWTTNGSGDWDVAANWSAGAVPGPADSVGINVPAAATVTVRSGTQRVRSLVSNEALLITGGSLSAEETIQVNNAFTLRSGAIKDTTLLAGSGGQGLTVEDSGNSFNLGTLDGVTTQADVTVGASAASARGAIKNGLTLDGATVRLGSPYENTSGELRFEGGTALAGTGDVVFGLSPSNGLTLNGGENNGLPLTIEAGVTVRGSGGRFDNNSVGTIVNEGTILADHSGGGIRAEGKFRTDAVIEARDGGAFSFDVNWSNALGATITAVGATLNLGLHSTGSTTTWSNAGTISAENSTVNFGGIFTGPGVFTQTGSVMNLRGVLNNAGETLTLDTDTGSWNLKGGRVVGGTVATADGERLRLTQSGGRLYGVTVAGDVDGRTNGGSAEVYEDLTLAGGTILLGDTYGDRAASLSFSGPQTLGGTGTVVFGRRYDNALASTPGEHGVPGRLTVGPAVTVRGAAGAVGGGAAVVNNGTIAADNSVAAGDFAYDRGFAGGAVQAVSRPIDVSAQGAAPAGLYRTTRYSADDFNYTLTGLAPGSYTVRLHFADLRNTAAGQGVFDVALNGMTPPELDDFDIFAKAGDHGDTAVVQDATATVTGTGDLVIGFLHGAGEIQVSGIEVYAGATVIWSADAGNVPADQLSVNGSLTNAGTVSAAAGRDLIVGGAFTQTTDGVVNIDVAGLTNFGRVTVGETATLVGTLNLTSADYAPTVGDAFPIMTWAGATGTFEMKTWTGLGGGLSFNLTYNPSDLTLDVVT